MDDIEDIKQKLRDAGIPFNGDWGPTTERTNIETPIAKKQKVALRRLESILQTQLEQDQKKVAALHVQLQRLKHGGGS
jgi:uncharacterized protein (DUF2461 family)